MDDGRKRIRSDRMLPNPNYVPTLFYFGQFEINAFIYMYNNYLFNM